ncbi:MAG: sulfotransferase [Cyanobacteria bacterium P01_G01_bin.39]
MDSEVKGRFFLVGCPRSGTTLLQSLIVAHSQVTSFPESKFFQKIVVSGSIYKKFNLAPFTARKVFNTFLADTNNLKFKRLLPLQALFIPQYATAFVTALDTITLGQQKKYWLEKTPEHLRRINAIEKLVPEAKFIHIVRNGVDVVASLYEMTQKFPQVWGQPRSLFRYVNRWSTDVLISSHHSHKPNHFVVRYENLLTDPLTVLARICEFMDLPFEASMLENRVNSVSNLIRTREHWKQSVNENLRQSNCDKFYRIFNPSQQEYILTLIQEANLDLDNLPRSSEQDIVTDCPCLI